MPNGISESFAGNPGWMPFWMVFASVTAGTLLGGLASCLAAYVFARRLSRIRVLDRFRQEIKETLSAYVDWLGAVAGEFSLWKIHLLPCFLPYSEKDQFELSRMRQLYVDRRNAAWMAKLEEDDLILGKFQAPIRELWSRQSELGDHFILAFKYLESDPPEAARAGEKLEAMAFEQSQAVSDFRYQLQYECLRGLATGYPPAAREPLRIPMPRNTVGASG